MFQKNKIQSVEPNVADLANGWLKSYCLDYKLEQESLNPEIDSALNEYYSKTGGGGGNRPDVKLLLQDKNLNQYPVLIEYKGYKDKLVKLDSDGKIANKTGNNSFDFKTINSYAVNGAVHYANALLHYTGYTDIIAIGMTGYKSVLGKLDCAIGVYYVSKSNFGIGQKVDDYIDFSFLKKENFDQFIEKIKNLKLTQSEIEKLKERREKEIDASLIKLNNDIYQNESNIDPTERVYLVAASIIATLGVPGKVAALEKSDLKSSSEIGNTDGDIILQKIKAFLREKNLPQGKQELIVRALQNTLTTENINKAENGESQLKRAFCKVVDDLGIYYKIGLTTDFTGKLFNEMYSWIPFPEDKLNDVVLTPSYVATLLVRLARVDKDSYVWDFATGSAGLLVAAMNEMLIDAKNKIKSPDLLMLKSAEIKANQLLGIEKLSSVYMLAILNMILMGDGSSNILNKDSLKDFDGNYGFGKTGEKFPANAFVLNPPYSAPGNGMIFVEKALSMMTNGYAAIIIQNSAGAGKAIEFNKKILKRNTLLASIKMPIDLFIGKSGVQTNIYVFRVGESHQKDDIVKFIDFSNDGYTRTNRKKASCNLRDTDHAKERYLEIVDLVRFGKNKLNFLTEQEYFEGHVNPENGADWNQTAPIDNKPTIEDLSESISEYLAWEASNVLKSMLPVTEDAEKELLNEELQDKKNWKEYRLCELFEVVSSKKIFHANDLPEIFSSKVPGSLPYVVRSTQHNGIRGYIKQDQRYANDANTLTFAQDTFTVFYQKEKYFTGNKVKVLKPLFANADSRVLRFIASCCNKSTSALTWGTGSTVQSIENTCIKLPQTADENLDFEFMKNFIAELEARHIAELEAYLLITGLRNKND